MARDLTEHVAALPLARRAADRRRSPRRAFCVSAAGLARSRRSRPARTSSSRAATRRSARSSARRCCTSATTRRSSPTQVRDALNFLQTTSPSYLLMASLDLVRRRMAREGKQLFAEAVDDARARERDRTLAGAASAAAGKRSAAWPATCAIRLRLVVNVAGTGWTGYEFEKYLRTEFQVEDEMADWSSVVYILSPQDDPAARRAAAGGAEVDQ